MLRFFFVLNNRKLIKQRIYDNPFFKSNLSDVSIDQIKEIINNGTLDNYIGSFDVTNIENKGISFIMCLKDCPKQALLSFYLLSQSVKTLNNVEILLIEEKSNNLLLDVLFDLPTLNIDKVKYHLIDTENTEFSRGKLLNYGIKHINERLFISWDVNLLCNKLFISNLLTYIKTVNFNKTLLAITVINVINVINGPSKNKLFIYDKIKVEGVGGFYTGGNEDQDMEFRLKKKYNLQTFYPDKLTINSLLHSKVSNIKPPANNVKIIQSGNLKRIFLEEISVIHEVINEISNEIQFIDIYPPIVSKFLVIEIKPIKAEILKPIKANKKEIVNMQIQEHKFKYPKLLHLYWDGSPLSLLNYLTVISFNKYHKGWKIIVYTPIKRTTTISWSSNEQKLRYEGKCYFDMLRDIENVTLTTVDLNEIGFDNNASEVIKSDYFRYYILYTKGGVWSDFDIIYTGSIEEKMCFTEESVIFYCGYYPIGLLMCVPNSKLYKYILDQCKSYYNKNEYQSLGANMLHHLFPYTNKIFSIDTSTKICKVEYYLPWAWNQLNEFLIKMDNILPVDNVGIHWFNGANQSKQYAINLEKRLDNFAIICYLDKIISEFILSVTENMIRREATSVTNKPIMNKPITERIVFIVPTASMKKEIQPTCIRCVKSIRKFYPDIDIIIINDSPQMPDLEVTKYFNDKNIYSYHPEVHGSGCSYALNLFNELPQYDKAIVIHDSAELIAKFDIENINCDIKFLWHFDAHYHWGTIIAPSGISHEREILSFYKNLADGDFKNVFEKLYHAKDNWRGCFGNMVVISKNFLKQLDHHTKILSISNSIKTRRDRMCMESIFALAVFYVKKFNVKIESSYSLQGRWGGAKIGKLDNNNGASGKYLTKYSFER